MSSDEDDSGAAMAAMMGFSSFASSRPTKKRRTNGHANMPTATSSNLTPLGTHRSDLPLHPPAGSATTPAPKNQPQRAPLSLPPPSTTTNEQPPADEAAADSDDPEPQYLDTSRAPFARATPTPPPTEEEAAAQQARIDAIIEAGNTAYSKPHQDAAPPPSHLDGHNSSSSRHGFRPSLIDSTAPNRGRGSLGDGGYALHPARPRGRGNAAPGGANPEWYVGYHDAAFNLNPWEELERKMGLERKGTWLTRA